MCGPDEGLTDKRSSVPKESFHINSSPPVEVGVRLGTERKRRSFLVWRFSLHNRMEMRMCGYVAGLDYLLSAYTCERLRNPKSDQCQFLQWFQVPVKPISSGRMIDGALGRLTTSISHWNFKLSLESTRDVYAHVQIGAAHKSSNVKIKINCNALRLRVCYVNSTFIVLPSI